MGDALGAIALAHIGDHLVAAVLAEVDVEVGHRHALRIEEALEQESEADGIEVGDGERVGHERARAGAAPRTDRNALRFGPLDEVGDDEEIALVVHAGNDAELEGEPLGIGVSVVAGGRPMLGEPLGETCFGLAPELGRFRLGERASGHATGQERRQDGHAL